MGTGEREGEMREARRNGREDKNEGKGQEGKGQEGKGQKRGLEEVKGKSSTRPRR